MNPRDLRPSPESPGYDPAQLSFGDVAAVPQLRVDGHAEHAAGGEEPAAVGFREPPVCGETSYDDAEENSTSWSVRVVQEAESTPPALRARQMSSPRPSAAPATPSARPAAGWNAGSAAKAPAGGSAGEQARPPARAPQPRASGPSAIPDITIAPTRPTPVAEPSAALDPLKRATELSPRDVDAAIAYANALDKVGNSSAALAALDACLSHGGDELRLICARAFLLGSRLKYELAEAELRRAAKLRADDPEVLLQTGILACRRARWRDAVEPLQRAAGQRSDDALAQFYLGEALNHVDQLAAALAAYERSTQLDSSNWRAFKGVGIVLDRMGRPADAAVAYRRMRETQGR